MIKLSVIIPCYNSAKWITRCLDSIPKRDDVEIIVVDDGSTDMTQLYVENYLPKVKYIKCDRNYGVSHARNVGLEVCKGIYVLFVDSDDFIYPDVCNKVIDNKLGTYDLLFYDMEGNNGERWVSNIKYKKKRYGMFKFIRRTTIGATRFDESLKTSEDVKFHKDILDKNPFCGYLNEIMYHYNFPRKGSLSYEKEMSRINAEKS